MAPYRLALLLVAAALALGAAGASGSWRRLSAAPIAPDGEVVSAWTRRRMLVFGRRHVTALDARGNPYVVRSLDVAASYDPRADRWRELAVPPGPRGSFQGRYSAAWTGSELLVWGPFDTKAYSPRRNRWRRLPAPPTGQPAGLTVWTGRELIGWGGGCCGDVSADGVAYSPAANRWRRIAPSPLAGSQRPVGAWTGRELIVLVGDLNPEGHPWPARLARAAAYDPATNTWRRIAGCPVAGGTAVWDGRELLVVAAGAGGRAAAAYDPRVNRWRRLAPLPSGRFQAAVAWTGGQVLVLGGSTSRVGTAPPLAAHGLAYDPDTGRWSLLPRAPVAGRLDPTAVWTGRALLVWGGIRLRTPPGTGVRFLADGAAFTP